MTKKFDELFESLLLEMMPASFEGDYGGLSRHISSNVPPGLTKGHWAPIQKLGEEDRSKVLDAILKDVFTEEDGKLVANADSQQELHVLVKSAIQKASSSTPLKAAGNWAAQFLADRIMTLLRDKIKYTTASGEEISKPATQKDFRKALNTALTKMEAGSEEAGEEASEEGSSEEPSADVILNEPNSASEEAAEVDLPEVQEKIYDILLSRKDSGKGPMRAIDLTSAIKIPFDQRDRAQAFVNSQLIELKNKGLIKSVGGGQWEAIEKTESGAVLDELGDENFEDVVKQAHRKLEMDTDPYGKRNIMKRDIARGYEGGRTRDFEDI